MSVLAATSIAAAVIAVPLLLASSFYFATVRLSAGSADQHFIDDLAKHRNVGLNLIRVGILCAGLSILSLAAARL